MEEIKIAFVELQTESVEKEFLLFKRVLHKLCYRLWMKKRIRNAVSRTVCREKEFVGEDYPLFLLPFSEHEIKGLTSAQTAELLNRISDSSDIVYFFYEPQLADAAVYETLRFRWVNEKAVFYIEKRELLPLCSQRLNIRMGGLKLLLVESYAVGSYSEHSGLAENRVLGSLSEYMDSGENHADSRGIVKVLLRNLYQQSNSLCILTGQQESYHELAEQIYEDCGLVIGFVRRIPSEIHLVVDASRESVFPYHHFPKSCAYLPFFADAEKKRILMAKRKDMILI